MGYNNDWLLKRPGSDIVLQPANTENHFNNCVRGGDSRMKQDGGDIIEVYYVDPTPVSWHKSLKHELYRATQRVTPFHRACSIGNHSITVVIRFGGATLIRGYCSRWAEAAGLPSPPVRECKRCIHPGIASRVVSYPYIEPTTILVLKIRPR